MGIKQLHNDNLRKLPNEYRDVSVMSLYLYKGRILGFSRKQVKENINIVN